MAVILGRRGSGKTTLARTLLRRLRRVIIVDPNHEYAPEAEGDIYESLFALRDAAGTRRRLRAIYRPPRGLPDDNELDRIDCVAHIAFEAGDLILAIDEADRYARHGKDTLPYLRLIIDQGRHRNVGLIAIARRAARLPKDLIEAASALYLFHAHEPYSRRYLGEIIGDAAEGLGDLPAGEYLEWDERRGVRRRRIALGPPVLTIGPSLDRRS